MLDSDMKKHIRRRHEQANPVNCPWCGKYVKCLDQHLQRTKCNVPVEERNPQQRFPCTLCDKTFAYKAGLKSHVKNIHEKIKDKCCTLCGYKTDASFNLHMHVKRMHEGKPLKESCPHCGKMVVKLDSHIKTYHEQNMVI